MLIKKNGDDRVPRDANVDRFVAMIEDGSVIQGKIWGHVVAPAAFMSHDSRRVHMDEQRSTLPPSVLFGHSFLSLIKETDSNVYCNPFLC